MLSLRYYQTEAKQAILDYWYNGGGNPLVEMATGTGKSLVIAELVKALMEEFPEFRVLMLTHVKELVEQNAQELIRAWPSAPIGINSAGMGRRDTWHPILFGSVQSLWRKPELLGDRDLIIIDECHLVPKKGVGMYRTLIDSLKAVRPDMRIAGFTATAMRLDSGRLDDGPDKLFDQSVYQYNIDRGIDDGFLAPPISRLMDAEISTAGMARRGGEFTDAAMQEAADDEELIKRSVEEIIEHGHDRKAWLAFCCGVEHAVRVAEAMRERGIDAATITGETTKGERASIIEAFKGGRLRCLTNANVLTTGFNAPICDLIALIRPTASTSLYLQMVGRGTRCIGPDITASIAAGKRDCLLLDFGGNIRRHGPLDKPNVTGGGLFDDPEEDEPEGEEEEKTTKTCKACGTENELTAVMCVACDRLFNEGVAIRHEMAPDMETALLSRDVDPWTPVRSTKFYRHEKAGSHPTLRVEYLVNLSTSHREWICFEHPVGRARSNATSWWAKLGGAHPAPTTIRDALARTGELHPVTHIKLKTGGRYPEIVGRKVDQDHRNRELEDAVPLAVGGRFGRFG